MTRRASFKQCDVTRALKAAKEAGVEVRVVITSDGTLAIEPMRSEVDRLRKAEEERARRGREITL